MAPLWGTASSRSGKFDREEVDGPDVGCLAEHGLGRLHQRGGDPAPQMALSPLLVMEGVEDTEGGGAQPEREPADGVVLLLRELQQRSRWPGAGAAAPDRCPNVSFSASSARADCPAMRHAHCLTGTAYWPVGASAAASRWRDE
ncbi:hypothetical protein GCM10010448_31320 [Streptomyces glomeratus]|uniref:Uncharacterized protein n=1 Tax=Streptomyces glomeratus TaxID=284452 RepID=A0ABP6LIB9_9ACTN